MKDLKDNDMKDIKDYIEIEDYKMNCGDKDKDCHHIKIKNDKALDGKEDAIKNYFKDIDKKDEKGSKLVEEKGDFSIFLDKVKYNLGTVIEDLNVLLNS